ncbi:DUF1801 domain-containing protein [Thalassospira xianhensis]|uniref:DUF1801 domain-containing protein n=1 Tax=Thalassospira xianhensis TaxID=478503 RepID=UPI000DED472C|nr:DUF1801 domain-containing protein [Thalassospira xianhensis]
MNQSPQTAAIHTKSATPGLAAELAAKLATYPDTATAALLKVRGWIFELAATDPAIGKITETLKWDEPAWLPPSQSGTTIRADWKSKAPDQIVIYVNCQTDLIDRVRSHFEGILQCEGNRAIILPLDRPLPEGPVKTALGWALTYHRDKRKR